MDGFASLLALSKDVHFASLLSIAISTILLIMPAAYHRIVYAGEDDEGFPAAASRMVMSAMVFLSMGVSGDLYVVCRKVIRSGSMSAALAVVFLAFCCGLW